jgi:hypothetical protein
VEKSRDAPIFAWIHLFDPHNPYAPRYPYDPYAGEIVYTDVLYALEDLNPE